MADPFLWGIPGQIATILSRLTAARAGYLDNLQKLDANVSTCAPASTAVSNAVLTPTRCGYLDNLATPAGINSVQRGITTINNATSVNVTITSVNMAKSFISVSVTWSASAVAYSAGGVRARLTATNNLELYTLIPVAASEYIYVAWEVITFN